MKKVIKTKRLVLRPYKKGDEEFLVKYANNKKIYRATYRVPYPYTAKDAKDWVAINIREDRKKHPEGIDFVIEMNGEAIGNIGLDFIVEGHRAELGYWLGEKFWGKGIMTEAVKAVTKFGFEELDLHRIYSGVYPFNKQSGRVLEKAGYQFEGVMRKWVRKNGKFIDSHVYAKVK